MKLANRMACVMLMTRYVNFLSSVPLDDINAIGGNNDQICKIEL
jgi:hypothetical protein